MTTPGQTEPYEVDDRGNVAQFYETTEYEIVATLDREAGDSADEVTWDGGPSVTEWAIANGYAEQIANARRVE